MGTSLTLSRHRWNCVYVAWMLALTATLGALFLSEFMALAPCELCWYQRIFMFPLVVVLGIGLLLSDPRVVMYAAPLAAGGWLTAAYHELLLLEIISPALAPCGQGPSCTQQDLSLLGFISIPLLSLVAFTLIAMLLWMAKGHSK